MAEITTPVDAVYAAYYASFDVAPGEVNNPDRRGLPLTRFVHELSQIDWWAEVTTRDPEAIKYPLAYLDSVLAAADDAAFTEGEVDENGDGGLNGWSPRSFVETCGARGVTFARVSA